MEKYLVKNPKKILTYLKVLSAERCLISAGFGEENKDTFLTAIMDINEKDQTITIDCGPREYLNKRLLNSAVIKCTAEYKGIKVLFEGRKIKKAGTVGTPAFSISIPSSIYWIQRRQFYRIKSPLSKKSYCAISFKNKETEEKSTIKFKLNDLSANGISFLNESSDISRQLIPSAEFINCNLVLDNEIPLTINIEVRQKAPQNPNKPEKTECIGCLITNITPRIESTLLRHIQAIEREIKQKE